MCSLGLLGAGERVGSPSPGPQAGAKLTLQVDGLTCARAVFALVEAACLVGRRYFLGGSNHHPGGREGQKTLQSQQGHQSPTAAPGSLALVFPSVNSMTT